MRPKRDECEPCVFAPDEVARLLSVSTEKDPKLLPYLTLGLFSGIRPEEIMRLNWGDITEHGINISGHKAKTRQPVSDDRRQLGRVVETRGRLAPAQPTEEA